MRESDSHVVHRVLSGDTEAYAELVRRHQLGLWKTLSAILLDFKTTEELVHQALVNAYLNLDQFDQKAEFGVWVKSIARNLVRREMRSRSRQYRFMRLYEEQLERKAPSENEPLAEALRDCRRDLPDRGSEILNLRYEQALGFEEIARKIGKTLEATRQHLSRLRLLLRDCIQKKMAHP